MQPTTRRANAFRAISDVLALPEMWAIVAEHSGVVGAWRLTGVCRDAREGAKEWLRTLPGLVVFGGTTGGGITSEAWRLDLGELRWERMPSFARGRVNPACCAVKGGVVVLGGIRIGESESEEVEGEGDETTIDSVEILGEEAEETIFVLPPLSCGPNRGSAALTIEESESEMGQVLLIGGWTEGGISSAVHKVDLGTGLCTPQPPLLPQQDGHLVACSAARLTDGRIVCVGRNIGGVLDGAAQVLEPPEQGTSPSEASWQWRYLPAMSLERFSGKGCVLSDGRFAVFGGWDTDNEPTRSCEVLTPDGDDERWDLLPPMHEARMGFACVAIGGCVIVAGGDVSVTAEVYEEALGRWRRLPCNIPYDGDLWWMGSASM
jgi:hypothetical protein